MRRFCNKIEGHTGEKRKKKKKNFKFFSQNDMTENRSGRSLDISLQVSGLNFRFFDEKMENFEKHEKTLFSP